MVVVEYAKSLKTKCANELESLCTTKQSKHKKNVNSLFTIDIGKFIYRSTSSLSSLEEESSSPTPPVKITREVRRVFLFESQHY